MNYNFLNIYNSLMFLTRNKDLYIKNNIEDTFSNRLILFLFHFAFFLKVYKKDNKQLIQKIYDFIFRQIDLSLREIGHGDVNINKKMKQYINIFHSIIVKIDNWENNENLKKSEILNNFINSNDKLNKLVKYFNKYMIYLSNNDLNFFLKSVNKHKF
tara:strand:- start:125 stop:595 length:471 start_codon:yes stop_codon:yes gene_type:complete